MMSVFKRRPRVLKAALLATTIIATPTLAQADPASLLALTFTVGGAAISGGAIAGLGATASAILGAVVALAGNILVQALFAPSLDTQTQRQGRTRKFDPHPPYRFAFGEFPQEGSVIFHHTDKKSYFLVYLLNSIPSESLTKVEINDGVALNWKSLDDDSDIDLSDPNSDIYDMSKGAYNTTPPWFLVQSDPDDFVIRMWVGRGEHTQPPQQWLDTAGEGNQIGDIIKSTDIWKGVTVAFVIFQYGPSKKAAERWSQGKPPPLRFFGKWSKLYDPRLDPNSGVSQFGSISPGGTHDINDRTTWEYSANPALAGLMLATHEFALGIDTETIPIQQWADAADDCDATDGGVSEVLLHNESWDGSAPSQQNVGNDAGSGNWQFNRGSVALGTGTIDDLAGESILQLISDDEDGNLANSELARAGVYIDMEENGRRSDIEYLLNLDIVFGGTVDVDKWRRTIYQADRGGEASSDDQKSTFMPPDAQNITTLEDTGYRTFGDGVVSSIDGVSFEGDYVSIVIEGGGPNGELVETSDVDLFTTSQAGVTRFRCDGLVVIEEREISILDPVLASMAGHLDTTEGLLGVRAGVWVAPTESLSQPVGDEVEVRGARDAGFDTVRAKFIGRHREWEETDGPGYSLRSGAREHPLQLPMVREPEQAARLEKIFALRAEPNRTVTGLWDGREANRRIGERVNFALPGFARASSSYVITTKALHTREVNDGLEVSVEMTLVEDLEANYGWTSGDYTEQEASTPPAQTTPSVGAPSSVTAIQSNYNADGEALARLRITVEITSSLSDLADEIRIETTDGSGYTHLTTVETVSGTTSYVVHLDPAIVGITYTARARAQSDDLGTSDYVTSGSVTIITPTLDYDTADYGSEYA